VSDDSLTQDKAQRRVDRIHAFRAELRQTEQEGGLRLTEEQRTTLSAYHDGIVADLERRFDVDVNPAEKQMSWGMRIASTVGALALAASTYFLFYRFWGVMATPLQIAVLISAPVLAVLVMELCSRFERTLYFTALAGLFAVACFVLNLSVLGSIFNMKPSAIPFLFWAVFALILAYAYDLKLVLVAGILSAMAYVSLSIGAWGGTYWPFSAERPENYIVAGVVAFAVPVVLRHRARDTFPAIYRLFGLLAVCMSVLVLSNWGGGSYLPFDPAAVEILYQVAGFVLAGLAIWIGIRSSWKEVTNLGTLFLIAFLYIKFFDWWWDAMPKYLFFLVLGLVAVGLLVVLRKFRSALRGTR
jgi:hypothetical protein